MTIIIELNVLAKQSIDNLFGFLIRGIEPEVGNA